MSSRAMSTLALPLLVLLFTLWTTPVVQGQCHRKCNGHGECDPSGRCHCYRNYQGPDCSLYKCPSGRAWTDLPNGTDSAHQMAVCSNMGTCDIYTGKCLCYDGFEGPACEHMSCPNACHGHGRCMSLGIAANLFDGFHLNHSTTYSRWDSEKIKGCVCDPGFSGYDCSLRDCFLGPDPRKALGSHEKVTLACHCGPTCTGSFRISYRGRISQAIPYSWPPSALSSALVALEDFVAHDEGTDPTDVISVTSNDTTICGTTSVAHSVITFVGKYGDLPPLAITSDNLVASGSGAVALVYLQTTQILNCSCTAGHCGGFYTLQFDGAKTREIPYNAGSSFVRNSLLALGPLQTSTVYSVSVSAMAGVDQMCPSSSSSGQSAFKVVIKGVLGNFPIISAISSLTESGSPGGTISVTSDDGTTRTAYCNHIGSCDFTKGVCTCPEGYGAEKTLGMCGQMIIKASDFTGVESCPGIVSQATWEPFDYPNPNYLYFTSYNAFSPINETGIYAHNLSADPPQVPRLVVNMTGLNPTAVALDLSERMIYYVDQRYKFIGRLPLDYYYLEKNVTGFITYNYTAERVAGPLPQVPNDLALDVRFGHRYVYFTVPGAYLNGTDGSIMRANMDGTITTTTLVSGLDYPAGIALDLMENKMYWTDGRNTSWGKVYRADLDGSNAVVLVSVRDNFTQPFGIALDLISREAFVAVREYTGNGYIVAFEMDTNATNFRLVAASNYYKKGNSSAYPGTVRESLLRPERVLLDPGGQWVYFTDSGTGNLRRVKYDGSKSQGVVLGKIHTPVGLAIDFGKGPPRYDEYYECYGHGSCSGFSGEFTCTCYDGWDGNCNIAQCPKGPAWFDEAIMADYAHRPVECSNRGTCDHQTGLCNCYPGFGGKACERLLCPNECSSHGRCMSMRDLARYAVDAYGSPAAYTYGEDPTNRDTWDAQALQGCYCDHFGYATGSTGKVPNYVGYDCSQRQCPKGHNPAVYNTSFEIQSVECYASAGTFSLTFRGATTPVLPWNVSLATIKTELRRLHTLGDLQVESLVDRDVMCSDLMVAKTKITYLTELGSVPLIQINVTSLDGVMRIQRLTRGTKVPLECADHGFCNYDTGDCVCFTGFTSSNYDGHVGASGDCGYFAERTGDLTFLHLPDP